MKTRVAFVVIAWGMCALFVHAEEAQGPSSKAPADSDGAAGPRDRGTLHLERLKRRDAEFDNRSLEIEQRWTEHVNPAMELAQLRFDNWRFGGREFGLPAGVEIPEPYQQPHRRHCLLSVRDTDIALDQLGDLAPPLASELQMRKVLAAMNYSRSENAGSRWVAIGAAELHYDPYSNIVHMQDRGSALDMYRRSYEWSCGYGFARWITSIDTIERQERSTLIQGTMRLLEDDETRFELELDRDLIVRRAVISIPGRPDGFDEYIIETSGTSESAPGAPLVAKRGHYRRIAKPAGGPEREVDNYEVVFVSLSKPMSDDEFNRSTSIAPKEEVTVIDRLGR